MKTHLNRALWLPLSLIVLLSACGSDNSASPVGSSQPQGTVTSPNEVTQPNPQDEVETPVDNEQPDPQAIEVALNPNPVYLDEKVVMRVTNPIDGLVYSWTQLGGDTVELTSDTPTTTQWMSPEQPAELIFLVEGRSPDNQELVATREFAVAVNPRPEGPTYDLQGCLSNPEMAGCFEGGKYLLSQATGSSLSTGTARQCNPGGLANWPHFAGALHEHTAYSDGAINTRPSQMFEQIKSRGLDFAVSTDHSDTLAFPISVSGDAIDACENFEVQCLNNAISLVIADTEDPVASFTKWQAIQDQAQAVTDEQFTGIRGFEWTSDRFGHINVLFSSQNINAKAGPGYAVSMDGFWSWFLAPASLGGGDDGLLVFNHPGREDALHEPLQPLGGDPAYTYNDFEYIAGADYRVVGVEVFGKGDEYDTDGFNGSWFAHALDKGWVLAPAGSEDHHGTDWGADTLPKTVLIARSRQPLDLKEAMLARRMYAVAQNFNDIRLNFNATETAESAGRVYPMGSRLQMPPGTEMTFELEAFDLALSEQDQPTYTVQIFSSAQDNSEGYKPLSTFTMDDSLVTFTANVQDQTHWYFARVLVDQTIVAVSAPIWLSAGDEPLPTCRPIPTTLSLAP